MLDTSKNESYLRITQIGLKKLPDSIVVNTYYHLYLVGNFAKII